MLPSDQFAHVQKAMLDVYLKRGAPFDLKTLLDRIQSTIQTLANHDQETLQNALIDLHIYSTLALVLAI